MFLNTGSCITSTPCLIFTLEPWQLVLSYQWGWLWVTQLVRKLKIDEIEIMHNIRFLICWITNVHLHKNKKIKTFRMHTGPTKRSNIKEGLLWWDLKKKLAEVPSERRVSTLHWAFYCDKSLFHLCRKIPVWEQMDNFSWIRGIFYSLSVAG